MKFQINSLKSYSPWKLMPHDMSSSISLKLRLENGIIWLKKKLRNSTSSKDRPSSIDPSSMWLTGKDRVNAEKKGREGGKKK